MISVREISFTDVRQYPNLLAEYARECSIAAIGVPNPQWEMYEALEQTGKFKVFAAYCDGRMVGFTAVIAEISPHYGLKLGNAESLFISKQWRMTRVGAQLLRIAEQHARDAGCKAFGRWRNGASYWKTL